MLILLILGTIALMMTLLFNGKAFLAWSAPVGLLLLAWFISGPGFLFWLLFLIWLAASAVFGIPALRKPLVSRKAMELLGPVFPKISETERIALEAGTVWWDGELFTGNPDWSKLLQFQVKPLSTEERAFLDGPVEELCRMCDDFQISRQGFLPTEVWDFIKSRKFMGMIIPKEYGGLGFSAAAHSAVVTKVSSHSVGASVTVMVPNSLGPAELLLHYGTQEQKEYYLPRLADGTEVPAFALTEPTAGSDAASAVSTGVICRGTYNGEDVLGMRLNWEKRYITLAPVATVLGLAFRLQDPDHLLGDQEDLGITCALIPTDTPGVSVGQRHDPLGVAFQNGPNWGSDVFVPLDFIIGGPKNAGQGWRMLMESLAAGRSISLPGLAVGACQHTARVTGAYATLRRQFGLSIGKFEGIQAPLGEIAGTVYMMDGTRRLTASSVDAGEKPAVISAIAKAYMTEFMRGVVNHGMDILAGAGISQGPRNTLAGAYHAVPIGITVEGANILTRSLIVYGQGAIRCHPYVETEITAVQDNDLDKFDHALWKHAGFVATNAARAFLLGVTDGRLSGPPATGPLDRYFGRFTRWSAGFTVLSDLAMGVMGADLKRKELISQRMADALAWMYLGSATLKRFYDEGQRPEHRVLAEWALQTAEYHIQEALQGVLQNFPNKFAALKARAWLFPLGARKTLPPDTLCSKAARLLLDGNPVREDLTQGIYVPGPDHLGLGRLEHCLKQVTAAYPVDKKLASAVREGRLSRKMTPLAMASEALSLGIITDDEKRLVEAAAQARHEAIQVDSFDPEYLCRIDDLDLLEKKLS